MKNEEIIIRIVGGLESDYPNLLDQQKVKRLIEEVLYDYEIHDKTKALVPHNDISSKITLFLASKKIDGISNTTLKSYYLQLTKFSNFMQKNLEDIDSMDIRMYLAYYMKTGVKNSTIATATWILKSFFSWLEIEEYISKNPMIKIKQIKVENTVREGLSHEEIEKIRDNFEDSRSKGLFEFFYSTGCRLDEVVKLNRKDIDWNRLCVKVLGKGNKERFVYLNATAKYHLEKYLESRTDDCEALFATKRNPIKRMGNRAIQREFGKMGKLAEINRKVFPHLIRHSMATTLVNMGVELTSVQKLLGHENASTTQRYGKLCDQNAENEFRKHFI